MLSNPRISVVLPAYNGEQYIESAIASLLSQSFSDFELIIINDGSTDNTQSIIENSQDDRVIAISNKLNKGIVYSLNKGIRLARGKYIARMDADDICGPTRLATQYNFLESHPNISICGSFIRKFNASGDTEIQTYPLKNEDIKAELLFGSALAHPSVMLRKDIFDMHNLIYLEEFLHAEDYALWINCLDKVNFVNLPSPLLSYREHKESVGNRFATGQNQSHLNLWQIVFKYLQIDAAQTDLHNHALLAFTKNNCNQNDLNNASTWMTKVTAANNKTHLFDKVALTKALVNRWCRLVQASSLNFTKKFKMLFSSKIKRSSVFCLPYAVTLFTRQIKTNRRQP